MSEAVRLCLACQKPLPADAKSHQHYHNDEACQAERIRRNHQAFEVKRRVNGRKRKSRAKTPICQKCGQPYKLKCGPKKVKDLCESCIKTSEKPAEKPERFKMVNCLGTCGGQVKSPLDSKRRPTVHFCRKCRDARKHDERYRWAGWLG